MKTADGHTIEEGMTVYVRSLQPGGVTTLFASWVNDYDASVWCVTRFRERGGWQHPACLFASLAAARGDADGAETT